MDWRKSFALLLLLILAMTPVAAAQDGVVSTSVLIAICVIVFFGTIAVVLCFIQFCIKNYNPLDYCYMCCKEETKPTSGKGALVAAAGGNSTVVTSERRTETVVHSDDLYAKVNKQRKTDREVLIVEKITGEGARENDYTTTTEVVTREGVQREQVFVHDSNIILREKPKNYSSEYEEGETHEQRFTYSTGYTPSSSQERLVVTVDDEDTDRLGYLLEHVEGTRKEVRTTPSGETVIVVREEPRGQHVNMSLNIQDEENGVVNEEVITQKGGVRRVTKRTVVTETAGPRVEETHREVRVIRAAPSNFEDVEIREVYQDDELSANHVENVVVSHHSTRDTVDEASEVQEAIDRIVEVTSAENSQDVPFTQTEDREEGDRYHVVTTQVTEVSREVEPSSTILIPTPDYPMEEEVHEERHGTSIVQRRGQSMKESYVVGQNIDGESGSNITRKRYTYHAEPSKVVYVEGKPSQSNREVTVVRRETREIDERESVVPVAQQSQTTVTREERVVETQPASTYEYYMTDPLEYQDRTSVVRREHTEYEDVEPTTTVVTTQSGSQGQRIIRREERVIEHPETTTYTYHMTEPPEQTSVERREYIEYHDAEPTTTVVRTQSGNQGQRIIRREERVIESPETTTYTYQMTEPPVQTSVERREYIEYHDAEPTTTVVRTQSGNQGQRFIRREERVIESPETTTYTYEMGEPLDQTTSVVRREYREYHDTEPTTRVVRTQSGSQGQTVIRREEHTTESEPTRVVYTYGGEGGQEESTIVRTQEYLTYDDDPATITTTEVHNDSEGQVQGEVTYKIIKRISQVVEEPEVVESTTNKDWYVSSASFVKQNPVETVYIDLGPEEKLNAGSSAGTTTTTTTTTSYVVDDIDQ